MPTADAAYESVRRITEEVNYGWFLRGIHKWSANLMIITVIAGEHMVLVGPPGTGKTLLAKSLARSIDCSFQRIQFTPDLLPSDVTGVSVWDREAGDFIFRPGPVFANVILGDEINRASPKTQAALLEAMEERQVTVDGTTRTLGPPFIVIATQNPIESEGTYNLPEAQLDRFMFKVLIEYPTVEQEASLRNFVRSTKSSRWPTRNSRRYARTARRSSRGTTSATRSSPASTKGNSATAARRSCWPTWPAR